MGIVSDVINSVLWVSISIYQNCTRKTSSASAVALAHTGGGASIPLSSGRVTPTASAHTDSTPLSSGRATSAAVAAAQGGTFPSPGFLEQVKGFFGFGASSVAVPSKPDTSWIGLTDGRIFRQNGIEYRICPTKGDGACALHAVLGTPNNGWYEYPEARETYAGMLNQAIIYTKVEGSNGAYFPTVQTLEGFLSDRLAEILSNSFTKETQALEASIIKLSPKPWFSKSFFDELTAELKQLQKEVSQGKRHSRDLDALRLKYAQDPVVKNAYVKTCSQRDYYFTDQEIEIMAKLFNKKVTIFGEASAKPVTYNPSGKEEVFVHFFKGDPIGHYSRVEIVL